MKMTRSKFMSLILGLVVTVSNTGRADESQPFLKVGEFTFNGAKQWKVKKAPRTMSAGGFALIGDKASLDADFYYFGKGQGGSIDANIARWRGQFESQPEPEKETLTFGDRKVHLIYIEGIFLSGRPFGPKTPVQGQAMRGAIVESAEGHVFVKMTGDAKSVKAASEAFKNLCSSPFEK